MEDKELTKYIESMCEDCELWIKIENCRECLFNVLCRKGKWED